MDTSKLMPGDWVLVADKGRCKVEDVYSDKGIMVKGGDGVFVAAENVYPEPLVSNELERNGWTVGSGGWWSYKRGRCRLGWRDGQLVIGYALVPVEAKYVHQMQQVMRFVGQEVWI